jgi:hypothetical protein
MTLINNRRAVGVFPTRHEAERALHELKNSGFPMDRVSIIAKDADRQGDIADVGVENRDQVGNKADEGAATGAVTGGALGGLTGLLVGLGALAIPGIGPIMLAGAGATALATTVAGGAIGAAAGGLVGALVGLGIPEERARVYSDRVSRGEYLVVVDGTEAEIYTAQAILNRHGIQEWGVYDRPNASGTNYVEPGMRTSETHSTSYSNRDAAQEMVERDQRIRTDQAYSNPYADRSIADEAIQHREVRRTEGVHSTPITEPAANVDHDPEVIIVDHRKPPLNS